MSGRVLLFCAGEQVHWKSPTPKQLIRVANDEVLLARTVRQCRARFSGEDPLLVSHLACLRAFSRNAIIPNKRRWVAETLLSLFPFWGEDWTILLLGDVIYSDELISLIISERASQKYKFYGGEQEIYAFSFTDYPLISSILDLAIYRAQNENGRGKLWDIYYELSGVSSNNSGDGRILLDENYDKEHFYTVKDGSRDFDTMEQFREWRMSYLRSEIKI